MTIRPRLMDVARRFRRRLNQVTGRDVAYRPQLRTARLHIGSDYGGWTVQPELLDADSIVYSVGVGEDVSFDLALIERFGCVVHAFDPTPKCLEWVASQTLPARFRFSPMGLADMDGELTFEVPGAGKVSCHIVDDAAGGEVVRCPVRRLETLMRQCGHARIDLLKMDIEGAEYAVIEDLRRCAARPRQLLVEFHHHLGDSASLAKTRAAVESLQAMGYRIFAISPTGFEYSFVLA